MLSSDVGAVGSLLAGASGLPVCGAIVPRDSDEWRRADQVVVDAARQHSMPPSEPKATVARPGGTLLSERDRVPVVLDVRLQVDKMMECTIPTRY